MEYLGKVDRAPARIKKNINSSRKFYEPLNFEFDDDTFNSFYLKMNKVLSENGKCIIEDSDKLKYIVDIEQINYSHKDLTADVFLCGVWKLLK